MAHFNHRLYRAILVRQKHIDEYHTNVSGDSGFEVVD